MLKNEWEKSIENIEYQVEWSKRANPSQFTQISQTGHPDSQSPKQRAPKHDKKAFSKSPPSSHPHQTSPQPQSNHHQPNFPPPASPAIYPSLLPHLKYPVYVPKKSIFIAVRNFRTFLITSRYATFQTFTTAKARSLSMKAILLCQDRAEDGGGVACLS